MAYKLVSPAPQQQTQARYRLVKPEKPLEWSDVPREALRNVMPSAAKYASDFVQPFIHPIDTAESIYSLGKGAVQHATGHEGPATPEMQQASAVKKYFTDRYGTEEGWKQALAKDPVGVMGDLSTVLTMGSGSVIRGPSMIGKIGKLGAAIDPLAAATAIPRFVGHRIAAHSSGSGPDALRIAKEAGRTSGVLPSPASRRSVEGQSLVENMRGGVEPDRGVEMAREGLRRMRDERHAAYMRNIAQTRAARSTISMNPIIRKFYALDQSLQAGRGLYKIDSGTQKLMRDISDELAAWYTDPSVHNAVGLDGLKQRIQAFKYTTSPEGRPLSPHGERVITTMSDAIKDEIIRRVPSYARAMQEYEQASKEMRSIERSLSLGERASTDTAARKLTSAMRNNVNTNYGMRTGMIDTLARRVPGLKEALAGQMLSSGLPRGLAGGTGSIGTLIAAMNPLGSPRLMGELAYAAGKLSPARRGINPILFQSGRENNRREKAAKALSKVPKINLPVVPGWPTQE